MHRAVLILSLSLFPLSGCGGSGGSASGTFSGAAQVSISTTPKQIDTGDRTEVRVKISRVHENGISLKLRFPSELSFVPRSATLEAQGTDDDVIPKVNTTVDEEVLIVFYFSQDDFGEDVEGTLRFELEALEELADGKIEVDSDVDDPRVSNDVEFDPENPEFVTEDEVSIKVIE